MTKIHCLIPHMMDNSQQFDLKKKIKIPLKLHNNTNLFSLNNNIWEWTILCGIYLPKLSSIGSMWHKLNFKAGLNFFFFPLTSYERLENLVCQIVYL